MKSKYERYIKVDDFNVNLVELEMIFYLLGKVGMNPKEKRFVSGIQSYYKIRNFVSVNQVRALLNMMVKWQFVINGCLMNWLYKDYNYEGFGKEIESFWKEFYGKYKPRNISDTH